MRIGCQNCVSGWILGPKNTRWSNIAMMCECLGGPDKLASLIENAERDKDPETASDIRRMFRGVSQHEWRNDGLARR